MLYRPSITDRFVDAAGELWLRTRRGWRRIRRRHRLAARRK